MPDPDPDFGPPIDISAEERRLTGQMHANRQWSKLSKSQRTAQTQAARDARWRKYLDAVPAEVTDQAERVQLARQAQKADLQAMQLKGLQALAVNVERRRAREARAAAMRAARARRAREARAGQRVMLTAEIVASCRWRHAAGESYASLARRFGVAHATMRKAVNGETWRSVPMSAPGDGDSDGAA